MVTVEEGKSADCSQAHGLTKEIVDKYFTQLKSTHEENGLMNSSRQLFNCDETFLPLNISCKKVISCKHTYAQAQGSSEHITFLVVVLQQALHCLL